MPSKASKSSTIHDLIDKGWSNQKIWQHLKTFKRGSLQTSMDNIIITRKRYEKPIRSS